MKNEHGIDKNEIRIIRNKIAHNCEDLFYYPIQKPNSNLHFNEKSKLEHDQEKMWKRTNDFMFVLGNVASGKTKMFEKVLEEYVSEGIKQFCSDSMKMFRNYFKMSQGKFSEATGLPRTAIANYEQGKSLLTYTNLIEANIAFNQYIEDDKLDVKKDCFACVMTGVYSVDDISNKPRTRYTHSIENFSIAKHLKELEKTAVNFEKEKLYSTYQKLSTTDKAKIMERMEYIISTYEDESAIPTKRIALLGQTACGNPIEAIAIADEFIETQDLRATFALRAVGDSMAPIINDGDIILIKQTEELEINDIGIFQINESGFSDDEEVTCKRYSSVTADGVITLSPLNAAYEPIVVDSKKEQIKIIGKYLGKA